MKHLEKLDIGNNNLKNVFLLLCGNKYKIITVTWGKATKPFDLITANYLEDKMILVMF